MATIHFLLSLLLLCFSPSSAASTSTSQDQLFTAKAAAIRYWNRKVPSNRFLPPVLLSQLSPLSAADSALYSSLPAPALSFRLPAFCAAARLLCSPSLDANGKQYGQIKANFFYHAVYKPKTTSKSSELTGLFFRVGDLVKGRVMPMKDIRDKMPARSFLPRSIAAKLPFSSAGVEETFRIPASSKLGKAVAESVAVCELPATRGESKRCPTSAEEMIDFVTSVFGSGKVAAHASSGFAGSRWPAEVMTVLVGEVKAASGGREITPVSCHQTPFPYMVYYCHSVPHVKLYEVEILDVETKEKMGVAVATCHMDTSDWTPQHAGLQALGSAPGKTEVCHWIYEGGMVWTVADK